MVAASLNVFEFLCLSCCDVVFKSYILFLYAVLLIFQVCLNTIVFFTGSRMLEQLRLIKWTCTYLFVLVTLSELLLYPLLEVKKA